MRNIPWTFRVAFGAVSAVACLAPISSAMNQSGAGCEKINYDPLVMADGIAATNDPVLLFRSPSYGVSAAKRLQGK